MKKFIYKTLSEDIFTNREEWLDYLYKLGTNVALRRTILSTAILGLRRLGKTELFKMVYNRLFFEQDEVIPIFWTFEEKKLVLPEFAQSYLRDFLRQYYAFKNKDRYKEFFSYDLPALLDYGMKNGSEGMQTLITHYNTEVRSNNEHMMMLQAIKAPKIVSDYDEEPLIVFIDEFQEVLNIRHSDGAEANCVGCYQNAVESLDCPYVITGSAKTLIFRDILSRGPLYGRFSIDYIKGMDPYFTKELVYKWCNNLGVEVSEEMTSLLAIRTGGNPFYIRAIVHQAAKQGVSLKDVDGVDKALITDLIRGAIWNELEMQVMKFINEQNKQGIGMEILYRAAKSEFINLFDIEKIAEELGYSTNEVKEMFINLARADILEEEGFRGTYFHKVNDPIMNEFLEVWCEIKYKNKKRDEVNDNLMEKYESIRGQLNQYKGITAQVYIQYMMTKWNDNEVDGAKYFGHDRKIRLPKFTWVDSKIIKHHETEQVQIDIITSRPFEHWFVECKYLKQ